MADHVFADAQQADQLANLFGHCWATLFAVANLPSPVEAEALALPEDKRGSLEDQESGLPAVPHAGEPHPEAAVSRGAGWGVRPSAAGYRFDGAAPGFPVSA